MARHLIYVVLIALLAAFLILLVTMNQRTPYTSEAVLEAPVIGIAPNVSGDIIEVGVRDNQRVKAGDLIFQIDPALFETALKAATAQLEYTIQQLGAESTGLGSAEAALVQATARLEDVQQQSARAETLFTRGIVARAAVDTARANLAAAQSNASAAEAQLAQARQRLGPQGEDNPQVRTALASREKAQIDLLHARVTSPVDGAVTNTVLSIGEFVSAGKHVARQGGLRRCCAGAGMAGGPLRRRHQPGLGPVGHAPVGPGFQGGPQRLGKGILGSGQIPAARGQQRDQPPIGRAHSPFGGTARGVGSRQAHPGMASTGRTSVEAEALDGALAAQSSAASRSQARR